MSYDVERAVKREKLLLGGATLFLSILPITLLVASIPLAMLVRRHGIRSGISTALISGLAAMFLSFNPFLLVQVLLVLALGIVIGEGLRENVAMTTLVVIGTIVATITTILFVLTFERLTGQSFDQLLVEFWQEVLAGSMGNGMETPSETVSEMIAHMRMTYPASLLLGSIGLTIVNLAAAVRLLRRFPSVKDVEGKEKPAHDDVKGLPSFGHWRFHKALSITFIIGWLIHSRKNGVDLTTDPSIWWIVMSNMMLLLNTFVTVHGMAVGWYYLRQARLSTLLCIAIMGLALLMPVIPMVLLIVGLIDGWVDLRRVNEGVVSG